MSSESINLQTIFKSIHFDIFQNCCILENYIEVICRNLINYYICMHVYMNYYNQRRKKKIEHICRRFPPLSLTHSYGTKYIYSNICIYIYILLLTLSIYSELFYTEKKKEKFCHILLCRLIASDCYHKSINNNEINTNCIFGNHMKNKH